MLTKEILLENITRPGRFWKENRLSRKERKAWTIFTVLRFMAIVVAIVQVFVFHISDYSLFHPAILITAVAAYAFIEALQPVRWYRKGPPILILLVIDLGVAVLLAIFSGGLYSPFLLFSLSPVLRAGLFLEAGITFSTAVFLAVGVISSHLFNPFFNLSLNESDLSFFFIYVASVSLSSVLPYLINVNLRQRLKTEDVLEERQRLSHEIHDGFAQTVAALRWQIQLLQRRLANMGIDLKEAGELEMLAEKAQYETRESLELLRNYRGGGSLLLYLREYLESLEQQNGINTTLDIDGSRIHLEPEVEIELLRICQEALTNVRKHSRAGKVSVMIKPVKGNLKVTIADDGCGFDANSIYSNGRSKCHGLSVMRERAESIGAIFEILTTPGNGAEIRLEVPAGGHWE